MDIKLKGSIILIVLLGALYYAFPTYKAYQTGVDPQTVDNKVNLGLDLQGGMYLDIEIKRLRKFYAEQPLSWKIC